jgi:hypothetical protein
VLLCLQHVTQDRVDLVIHFETGAATSHVGKDQKT